MRRLINRIFVFTAFPCLFLFLTILIVKKYSSFKINENLKMIVVGDSHSECAFNDSLIRDLSNFSSSADTYFYIYYKTRKLIEQNPQINTVFIEFSNLQIDKHMDEWIWGDMYMSKKFPKYALFMDKEAYKLLYEKNPTCLKQSLIPVLKNNIIIISQGLQYTRDIGGYLYLVRDKTNSPVKELSKKRELNINSHGLSNINIGYLLKLIEYCERNHLKVFLIRSPLHEKYIGFQNEQIFQELLSSEFSNVEFLDFAKYPLLNSEFGDFEHLNHKGAKKFSIWFDSLLKDGLLEKTNKQTFIDEKIKAQILNIDHM